MSLESSLKSLVREVTSTSHVRIEFQEKAIPNRMPMPIIICLYCMYLLLVFKHTSIPTYIILQLRNAG